MAGMACFLLGIEESTPFVKGQKKRCKEAASLHRCEPKGQEVRRESFSTEPAWGCDSLSKCIIPFVSGIVTHCWRRFGLGGFSSNSCLNGLTIKLHNDTMNIVQIEWRIGGSK